MPLIALTRAVPESINRCELTHREREPIDRARAAREHEAYEACLRRLGCRVERLPALPDNPDSVFVEDTAVVVDDLAVIARPGAESRRGEVASTAAALAGYRPLAYIQAPATLDGGDVLVAAPSRGGGLRGGDPVLVFVGISGRTNQEGARQLATLLAPHGFKVAPVPVTGCLHLKSAVTAIPGNDVRLLLNPSWIDPAHFRGFELIEVDPAEPYGANVVTIGDSAVCAEAHPRTRRRLEAHGIITEIVSAAELAKAEGGLTCGSIIFTVAPH